MSRRSSKKLREKLLKTVRPEKRLRYLDDKGKVREGVRIGGPDEHALLKVNDGRRVDLMACVKQGGRFLKKIELDNVNALSSAVSGSERKLVQEVLTDGSVIESEVGGYRDSLSNE